MVIRRRVQFRLGPWRPPPLPRPVADMQEQSWRVALTRGLPNFGGQWGYGAALTAVSVDALPSQDRIPGMSAASTLDSPAVDKEYLERI